MGRGPALVVLLEGDWLAVGWETVIKAPLPFFVKETALLEKKKNIWLKTEVHL